MLQPSPGLLSELIARFRLDLHGLTVYTEAASGSYRWNAVLAALAGARVFAQTRDSRFASANEVKRVTLEEARRHGVGDRIEVLLERSVPALAASDIVTNSGFVRPFDAGLIEALKPTAVIPLMWETWEFRSEDFDLERCRERGILVLGTDEGREPLDMSPFIALSGLKLLLETGFDGGRVLVVGGAGLPAEPIVKTLRLLGIETTWASPDGSGDLDYDALPLYFETHGNCYDVALLAEHRDSRLLLGPGGLLDYVVIRRVRPDLRVGIMCGSVDITGLPGSGVLSYPSQLMPFGFMSYQPYMLGPRPVLSLFAAGLCVGQAMARARLEGLSVGEAAARALASSPAMDFPGEGAWV